MLNSNVKSLRNDSVSNLFVDDNSESSRVDIEDSTGSAVIIFIWHGFMNRTIHNNVNNITNFIGGKILGHSDGAVISESFLEFVSCSSFISVAMSHGSK